jgi:diguanylate cyclase (GGDEF)-like protein/PAS domain S-box-containing protein
MSNALERKLISITWPFVAIVILMLSLSMVSMSILSAARAYVGGEGLWSKAERDAVSRLLRFSRTGDGADYAGYLQALNVPLGDQSARLALLAADPDQAQAARGFLAGQNNPADVPGMIRLFRAFKNVPLFRRAIDIWTRGDALILQLQAAGDRLHGQVASTLVPTEQIAATVAEIEAIHRQLAPLEDQFSATIGEISRTVAKLLSVVLAFVGVTLLLIGAIISRNLLRRTEQIEEALRLSREVAFAEQELSHVTLHSIGDAVISTDRVGRIRFLNTAAEQLTGWSAQDARERPLSEVHRTLSPPGSGPEPEAIAAALADGSMVTPTTGTILIRRDGRQTPVNERAAPIRDKQGQIVGFVLVLRDVTQERALAAQLQHLASHDELTGLVNRREFERLLDQAIEGHAAWGRPTAVLYLDLDQFKVINDTCGHQAGDELMRQVAGTVVQQLTVRDTLARLGGDEFGILLPDCDPQRALQLGEEIRRHISESRFAWQDKSFSINASIGILSIGDTPMSVSAVLSAADQACYAAKDHGRNRVQVYRRDDGELRARQGEMQWVERLNRALERDKFELYAQPIQAISSDAGSGAEAHAPRFEVLLRMVDERGGLIAPMAFIPAAERYGLMPAIDQWVIARACRELGARRRVESRVPKCMINLSAASVTNQSLPDFVATCISDNDLPPDSIGFELTETAAVSNLSSAGQLMRRLKALGCCIALDDFGTGMSSFAYLRKLPIDYLKIDGEFVKDMVRDAVDYAMVEAIQRIGRVIGIKTVAEWVEDEATLNELALIGVDYVQGFRIGVPIPLAEWLDQWDRQEPLAFTPPRLRRAPKL